MATKWLNIYLKFSGLNYSLKKKLIEAESWYRAVPYVFIIVIFELGFAIISIPLYLIVPPKKVQEEGFLFPSRDKALSANIRLYTARRKISLGTFFSALILFLIKAVFIGTVSLYLLGGQPLLAATQNWTFDTAGDYTYDSAKIEVTGGVAQLKNLGGVTSGSTTNSAFTTNSTGWTAVPGWNSAPGKTNVLSYISTGGNTGGYIDLSLDGKKANSSAAYWYQAFTTTVNSPTTATLNLDWKAISLTGAPSSFRLYAFVGTDSGNPTIGGPNQVWDSGNIAAGTSWASISQINIASKVPTAGTYYLKIAAHHACQTSVDCGTVSGFDNVIVNWSKSTVSYATDKPTIKPITSLNPVNVVTWNSLTETATKNGGEIYYQLSNDDGATWKYWNGSVWATAGATNYNGASAINTNISTFSAASKKIMWKAFLESNGSQQVILDNIAIGYTENDLPDILNLAPSQNTTNGSVYVNYNLQDDNSDPSSLVTYQYSLTGAFTGEEVTMTPLVTDPNHNGISSLSSSPAGTAHTFVWDAKTQLGAIYSATAYVRLRANDGIGSGPYYTSSAFIVDYVNPIVSNVSAAQTAGTTNVVITYDLTDNSSNNLVIEVLCSADGGSTWTLPCTSTSGAVGSGQTTGVAKTITWAAKTDYNGYQQSNIQIKIRAKDKYQNQGAYTSSANFNLDTLNPAVSVAANLQTQPNAGNTTVLIGGSFTETNPDTNIFMLQ